MRYYIFTWICSWFSLFINIKYLFNFSSLARDLDIFSSEMIFIKVSHAPFGFLNRCCLSLCVAETSFSFPLIMIYLLIQIPAPDLYSNNFIATFDNKLAFLQVKCWQIRRQTKAPQAAGAIHTDFERGFICAEVIFWQNFLFRSCFGIVDWVCISFSFLLKMIHNVSLSPENTQNVSASSTCTLFCPGACMEWLEIAYWNMVVMSCRSWNLMI